MEQSTGIEPAYSAWEAEVLPLNYDCSKAIIYVDKNMRNKKRPPKVAFQYFIIGLSFNQTS